MAEWRQSLYEVFLHILIIQRNTMLKGLKAKKDGKGDAKKDVKKEKETKKEAKKQVQEEEEDTNDALVEINYDEKETTTTKKINKIQSNKLEEKEIDVSNIPVEKKQQAKPITSWVVDADKVKDVFREKFDMNKVDTEFISLTDSNLNKQLEEKAKREAEQNKHKVVEEKGGIKFAVLEKPAVGGRVDVNDGSLNFRKPTVDVNTTGLNPQIQVTSINPPQFTNSTAGFAKIEKTPQQLKEEELQKKMELATKNTKGSGWLGNKPKNTAPQPEFKVSAWAQRAMEDTNVAPVKFAPLENNERKPLRQQQEFVFVSKKEQDERRKKREERELAEKAVKP